MKKKLFKNCTFIKNSRFKSISLIFILLFLFQGIEAQVLWYGDPDLSVNDNFRRLDPNGNSNPTGDRCVDDPNNPPFVTTPTDPEFGKFWRITKPTSRKRAEFARTTGDINDFVPQKGGVYYYGWRWRINATPNLNDDIAVFQWKTDDGGNTNLNKQNYPFNMEYDGTILSFNAFGPGEPNWDRPGSITQRRTTLWRQAIPENQWVSFVIKINVDDTFDTINNRYEGYLEFWFNGEQQTLTNFDSDEYQASLANSNTRAYHKTFDGVVVYPKWGSYNENACDFETFTDYDEMRVTTTFESALPDNSGSNTETGLEGAYKIKNVLTGNYMTYNSNDDNIYASGSIDNESQIFRLVKNGNTSAGGDELYNIDSEFFNVGVLRAESLNLFATITTAPSTSNPNSFTVIDAGGGIYNFLANTNSLRYVAEDLDNGNIRYTNSAVSRAEWVLEAQTLSNKNVDANNIKMYPNPVKDFLFINNHVTKISQINIYNLSGKLLQSEKIKISSKSIEIKTDRLLKGLYLIEFKGKFGNTIKKFIKN